MEVDTLEKKRQGCLCGPLHIDLCQVKLGKETAGNGVGPQKGVANANGRRPVRVRVASVARHSGRTTGPVVAPHATDDAHERTRYHWLFRVEVRFGAPDLARPGCMLDLATYEAWAATHPESDFLLEQPSISTFFLQPLLLAPRARPSLRLVVELPDDFARDAQRPLAYALPMLLPAPLCRMVAACLGCVDRAPRLEYYHYGTSSSPSALFA